MAIESTTGNAPQGGFLKSLLANRFFVAVIAFALVNIVAWRAFGPWESSVRTAFAANGKALSQEKTFTWWVTRAYVDQKSAPDIVLMGSSQMGSATFASDAHVLQKVLDFVADRRGATLELDLGKRLRTKPQVFNWSMGGAMVSDAFMIGKALFQGTLKPKMVVIGVNPRDFIDNSLNYPGMTEPFRFFSQFVDPGELTATALPDPLPRLEWTFERCFPLRRMKPAAALEITYADKTDEAAKAAQATGQNKLIQGISGSGGEVRPGQWVLPANMPYIFQDNTKEYERRYKNANPPLYAAEKSFFTAFLNSMREKGIKVLVVGMPSLPPNRALLSADFWSGWRRNVTDTCAANGAHFIDLTQSSHFVMDDYLDTVHMNAQGGAKLFDLLAREITERKDLSACFGSPAGGDTKAVAGVDTVPQ